MINLKDATDGEALHIEYLHGLQSCKEVVAEV